MKPIRPGYGSLLRMKKVLHGHNVFMKQGQRGMSACCETNVFPTVKSRNARPRWDMSCSATAGSANLIRFSSTIPSSSPRRKAQIETRSLAWQIGQYGTNETLQLVEKLRPSITKPNQVLIEVHASSVNPIDIRTRGGYGAILLNRARGVRKAGDEFPLTLGRDCSGVVSAVGEGVKEFREGDNVWATVNAKNQGCHAQHVVATANEVSLKPENMSHIEAASIPYVATTNWSAAYAVAKFRPGNALGKRALIFGGSGGIGTLAIQLLKAWGANVTVTCSRNAFDLVHDLGAHRAVDYRSPDLVRELSEHGKYDFILNAVGDSTEDVGVEVIQEMASAQYVTLVTPFLTEMDRKGAILGGLSSSVELFRRSRKFSSSGGRFRWAFAQPNGFALQEVAKLVESGKIRAVVDQIFPFEELPLAYQKVEGGHVRGKVVVDVAGAASDKESGTPAPQFFKEEE